MGAGYRHTCDACGYTVSTSGPWEFYRDSTGQRKPYGHPGPSSPEAKARGIAGFSAMMYCSSCDKVVDVIMQEYPTTFGDPLGAWLGASNERLQGIKARCPDCGGTDLVLGGRKDAVVLCPRCRAGHLVAVMAWIS
jgi:hypothetical protein